MGQKVMGGIRFIVMGKELQNRRLLGSTNENQLQRRKPLREKKGVVRVEGQLD